MVPTYNRARTLSRALDSVLSQTYPNFELIVVDDHSSDATPQVVDSYAEDSRVKVFRHDRNLGQSRAFNTGIAAANGDYVGFLDDDDEWLPNKLALQVATLDAAPCNVGLVYGWRHELDEESGRILRTVRHTMRGDIFEKALMLHTPAPPSSWLVRVSAARALGGFEGRLLRAKDDDFVCRLCEQGWHVDYVPEVVLLRYRHKQGQMTDATPENLALRAAFVRRHLMRYAVELRERPAACAQVHLRCASFEVPHQPIHALLSVAKAVLVDPAKLSVKLPHYARRFYYMLRDATRNPSSRSRPGQRSPKRY